MSSSFRIDPESFQDFTYSRRSHWALFKGYDKRLYGKKQKMDRSTLKVYQDLLVFVFIKEHIPPGSRILDVGGGDSRILKHLASTYECWNIDKLEGLGNGPRNIGNVPYKLVHDYMGNFNTELPDNYFDFVFSISVLEHLQPQEDEVFDNVINDINRVLRPNAFSLHLIDVVFKADGFWINGIIHRIFERVNTLNNYVSYETMQDNTDLYFMSKAVYEKTWINITKKPYSKFGRPSSLNILWRKT